MENTKITHQNPLKIVFFLNKITQPRVNAFKKDGLTNCEGLRENIIENFVSLMKDGGGKAILFGEELTFGYKKNCSPNNEKNPFFWTSRFEFYQRFRNFGVGLLEIGFEKGHNLGLYFGNCLEWIVAEFACMYVGGVSVGIMENIDRISFDYISVQAEIQYVVTNLDRAKNILKYHPKIHIKYLILAEDIDDDLLQIISKINDPPKLITIVDLEYIGSKILSKNASIHSPSTFGYCKMNLDDVYTICYTSGTTGTPKGVVLTYRNFLSVVKALSIMKDKGQLKDIDTADRYMIMIPLAHAYGRVTLFVFMFFGSKIGFPSKDYKNLLHEIQQFRPTIFVAVPLVFNKIKDQVWQAVEKRGLVVSSLFKHALRTKVRNLKYGSNSHWLYDKVVFKSVRDQLGGKVGLVISGSAPSSPDMLDFVKCCFSGSVVQGYGSTETTGPSSLSLASDLTGVTVGPPISNVMIKLVDVPEMGYYSSDLPNPRGEVCVFGNCVFKEYYKSPTETRAVFDDDGFFLTGDIGMFDELGRLVIIDRKKHIFKLSQGEYIAPDKVERAYMAHPLVDQIFIYGSPIHDRLIGIIVPHKQNLLDLISKELPALKSRDFNFLCSDPLVVKLVASKIRQQKQVADLHIFENISTIYLDPVSFNDNSLITPLMKLDRKKAQSFYMDTITNLYKLKNK
ncbi:Long chain acyl-CoA synthetase 7, peroxisomal [Smittium mucronatum]|uniref:Long chain acyl-CoA synthetase 7, peroxisomal n=1 Tax=Smittium mucronatum TaxID=133383 RepID=A0A1R0H1G8_9FUNG|nr:Long chain acyl-CoA synthetase 7, peroxisomal [Smittium mucronatum]